MARIAVALVVVVLAVTVQGAPAPSSFDDIVEAAKSGKWEQFQTLLNANLAGNPDWRPVDFHSIKDLKPSEGGQVYGEAEYTFQSSSDFNGQKTEEQGGHKIINDNGDVREFDINPYLH